MRAEFITVQDPRWRRVLTTMRHDFYHLPEYVALCAKLEGAEPLAFYAEDGESRFLAPVLLRPIASGTGVEQGWCDCASPYGYSTPLIAPSQETLPQFLDTFVDVGRQRHMVTAFFRLHPFLGLNATDLDKFGRIVEHGQTIYIDLSRTSEDIWGQMSTNHRRNIRRLERLGFRAVLDEWSLMKEFIAIYYRTMSRVGAREKYHFPQEYFDVLQSVLGSRLHLCCVLSPQGHIAAAGLFVATDGIVQYHLGGTAEECLALAPSKLMFHFVRQWGQQTSQTTLHLGGGVGGIDDSLLQFKAGFSNTRARFCTYRMIVDGHKHETLLRHAAMNCGTSGRSRADFFPAYRQHTPDLAYLPVHFQRDEEEAGGGSRKVLRHEGIDQPGNATMEEPKGAR